MVLAAAAMLVGVPWLVRGAAVVAVAGHGIARRPPPPPERIVLTADAHCSVPQWHAGLLRLGARTLVCAYWIALDCDAGSWRRNLVLYADQLNVEDWTRLRAFLARISCE